MNLRPFAGLVGRPGRGIRPLSGSRVAHGTRRRLQQHGSLSAPQGAHWKGVFGPRFEGVRGVLMPPISFRALAERDLPLRPASDGRPIGRDRGFEVIDAGDVLRLRDGAARAYVTASSATFAERSSAAAARCPTKQRGQCDRRRRRRCRGGARCSDRHD
jgi:hypothetical protein